MRNKKIIWLIAAFIQSIIYTTYQIYQQRVEKWNNRAQNAFEDILQQEITRRDTISTYYYTSTRMGKEEYHPKKRNLQSPMLTEQPFNIDSLNREWHERLYQIDIPIKTCLRMCISGPETSVLYSKSPFDPTSEDSLFSYRLGAKHEVELTGFTSYHWWYILDGKLPYQMCFMLFACLISLFIGHKQLEFILTWTAKRHAIKAAKIQQKATQTTAPPTMTTANVSPQPAALVKNEGYPVYQLEEEVIFDVGKRILCNKEKTEKLTPQLTALLEAFLSSERKELTQKEIDTLLWPDGSGTPERLYTVICRLRKSLEKVSTLQVGCMIDIYQLRKKEELKSI